MAPMLGAPYRTVMIASVLLRPRTLVVAGLSLVAGIGPLSAAARHRGPSIILAEIMSVPEPSGESAAEATLRPVERNFILQGLANSRTESELSGLAVSQASRSDIRDFAQQLATDYRQINTTLETLARKKAVEPPLQPTSLSDQYRQLAQHSGSTFDQAFIREISIINQRSLQLCEKTLSGAKDNDIRDLIGTLLPIIRDHVNKSTELEKTL